MDENGQSLDELSVSVVCTEPGACAVYTCEERRCEIGMHGKMHVPVVRVAVVIRVEVDVNECKR